MLKITQQKYGHFLLKHFIYLDPWILSASLRIKLAISKSSIRDLKIQINFFHRFFIKILNLIKYSKMLFIIYFVSLTVRVIAMVAHYLNNPEIIIKFS